MVAGLREDLGAEIVVFSRDPEDTKRRHDVEAVPVRTMTKEESRRIVDRRFSAHDGVDGAIKEVRYAGVQRQS